jgi:hypothetical protein
VKTCSRLQRFRTANSDLQDCSDFSASYKVTPVISHIMSTQNSVNQKISCNNSLLFRSISLDGINVYACVDATEGWSTIKGGYYDRLVAIKTQSIVKRPKSKVGEIVSLLIGAGETQFYHEFMVVEESFEINVVLAEDFCDAFRSTLFEGCQLSQPADSTIVPLPLRGKPVKGVAANLNDAKISNIFSQKVAADDVIGSHIGQLFMEESKSISITVEETSSRHKDDGVACVSLHAVADNIAISSSRRPADYEASSHSMEDGSSEDVWKQESFGFDDGSLSIMGMLLDVDNEIKVNCEEVDGNVELAMLKANSEEKFVKQKLCLLKSRPPDCFGDDDCELLLPLAADQNIDRVKTLINSLMLCVDEFMEAVPQKHLNNAVNSPIECEQISDPVVHSVKRDDESRERRRKEQYVQCTGVWVALMGRSSDQLKGVMMDYKSCQWKSRLLLCSVDCKADCWEQSHYLGRRILLKEQRRIMDQGGGKESGSTLREEGSNVMMMGATPQDSKMPLISMLGSPPVASANRGI